MEFLIACLQVVFIVIFFILINYIRKIPERIHGIQQSKYEHDLDKQLESFKTELMKEIEILRIAQTQLHTHKSEEFVNLIEILYKSILDKDYLKKMENNKKLQTEFNSKMSTLGTKLFFFASDDTVKKYVEWRKHGQLITDDDPKSKNILVILMAELMVLIRKDLGYQNTICNKDDFLYIMLTDWDKHKDSFVQM